MYVSTTSVGLSQDVVNAIISCLRPVLYDWSMLPLQNFLPAVMAGVSKAGCRCWATGSQMSKQPIATTGFCQKKIDARL